MFSCKNCKFSHPAKKPELQISEERPTWKPAKILVCRRYPPTVNISSPSPEKIWPQVAESFWCGEYQENFAQEPLPKPKPEKTGLPKPAPKKRGRPRKNPIKP